MKSPSSVAALLLGFAALAATGIAWQQYLRAERLERALASVPAPEPAVAPAAAVASTEAEEDAVIPAEVDDSGADAASETAAAEAGRRLGDGPRADPSGRFSALMENPEYLAAWQAQQRGFIDNQYGAFFRRMNLSASQIERLKALLVERAASRMDVMNAARREGLTGRDSRDDVRALVQQAENEIAGELRSVLGETGLSQLQQYERTAPQRQVVNQVEDRLSYSATPLSPAQHDALVSILAETAPAGTTPDRPPMVPIRGGGSSAISEAAIARAQGVLSPSQVEALREVQAQQQAQRQMSEIMRREFRNQRPDSRPGN